MDELSVAGYSGYSELRKGDSVATLGKEEALRLEPKVNPNVLSAVRFGEYFIDPFRLILLNALNAKQNGAQLLTYTEVTDVLREGNTVTGARVKYKVSGETRDIKEEKITFKCELED